MSRDPVIDAMLDALHPSTVPPGAQVNVKRGRPVGVFSPLELIDWLNKHYTPRWTTLHLPRPTELTDREIAELTKSTRRTVQRWRSGRTGGMTLARADKIATELGRHPADIWSNYWTTVREDAA